MKNGCPQCEKLTKDYLIEWGRNLDIFCLAHQLEMAEQTVYAAMNEVERLKQKIEKEQEDVSTSNKYPRPDGRPIPIEDKNPRRSEASQEGGVFKE